MNIQPQIRTLAPKLLLGQQLKMSVAENKTGELWRSFIPRLPEIKHRLSEDKISLQVYPLDYFGTFDPLNVFVKWAAVEVEHRESIPAEIESFDLPGGLYAVFHYQGASTDQRIFHYIYSAWLPRSNYLLDDRPHFEVLGEKYKNNDPNSEEEIWIPIKEKP